MAPWEPGVGRRNSRTQCKRISGGPEFALSKHVEADGSDDNRTNDHLLPIRIDPQQVASIRKQTHNEGSDECSSNTAFATLQASSSNHDRSNRLQFVTLSRGGLASHQTRSFDHASQTGQQACNSVYGCEIEVDRHTCIVSSTEVAPDRKCITPKFGVFQK